MIDYWLELSVNLIKFHLFLLVIGVVIFIWAVFGATAIFRCDVIRPRAANCLALIVDVDIVGTLLGRCCWICGCVCCTWFDCVVPKFTFTLRNCCGFRFFTLDAATSCAKTQTNHRNLVVFSLGQLKIHMKFTYWQWEYRSLSLLASSCQNYSLCGLSQWNWHWFYCLRGVEKIKTKVQNIFLLVGEVDWLTNRHYFTVAINAFICISYWIKVTSIPSSSQLFVTVEVLAMRLISRETNYVHNDKAYRVAIRFDADLPLRQCFPLHQSVTVKLVELAPEFEPEKIIKFVSELFSLSLFVRRR